MPSLDLDLRDCILIIVRNGESRPEVINVFSDEAVRWITTRQPELLELIVRAVRLAGSDDGILDRLNVAAGGERGDDAAWLEASRRIEPDERPSLRLLREGDQAA